jgi:hypothetical protein
VVLDHPVHRRPYWTGRKRLWSTVGGWNTPSLRVGEAGLPRREPTARYRDAARRNQVSSADGHHRGPIRRPSPDFTTARADFHQVDVCRLKPAGPTDWRPARRGATPATAPRKPAQPRGLVGADIDFSCLTHRRIPITTARAATVSAWRWPSQPIGVTQRRTTRTPAARTVGCRRKPASVRARDRNRA